MTYFRKKKILARYRCFFLLVTVPMSFSATVSTWLLDEGQGQVVQESTGEETMVSWENRLRRNRFDPTRRQYCADGV